MDPVTYPTVQLARAGNPAEFDTYHVRFSLDAMEFLIATYNIDISIPVADADNTGMKAIERMTKVFCGGISDFAKVPYEEMRKRVDLLNLPMIAAAISAAISKVPPQAVVAIQTPLPATTIQ